MSIKKFRKILKNNKGFSLIELIVVIAILGVLAGVAAPNVIGYVKQSKISADIANAATIANAIKRGIAEGKITSTDNVSAAAEIVSGSGIGQKLISNHYIDAIPTPKASTSYKFYITVDASTGLITVAASDGTNSNALYPTPLTDSTALTEYQK